MSLLFVITALVTALLAAAIATPIVMWWLGLLDKMFRPAALPVAEKPDMNSPVGQEEK